MKRHRYLQTKRNPRLFVPTPYNRPVVIPLPKLSLMLILILTVFLIILAFRSDLLLVHEVLIQSQPQPVISNLIANDIKLVGDLVKGRTVGRSIIFVNQKRLESEIRKNFLTINQVTVTKNLPNQISVSLTPRLPTAEIDVWSATDSGKIDSAKKRPRIRLVSDETGYLFAQVASTSGIPVINIFLDREIRVGDRLQGERVKEAIDILDQLKKSSLEVAVVELVGVEAIKVRLKTQMIVVFSGQKEVEDQVASLQAVIDRHRMEKREIIQIDLRYNKPVVKYK